MKRLNIFPTPMWGSVPLVAALIALLAEWSDSLAVWYWYSDSLTSYHTAALWIAPTGIMGAGLAIFGLALAESRYNNEGELE